MPVLVTFTKSERSNKKYVLRFLNPKFSIHFGSKIVQFFKITEMKPKRKAILKDIKL